MENTFHFYAANTACALLYSYIIEHNQGIWLLPVNICPDVPLTFCLAHVQFEFVDINPITLFIDEEICLDRLSHASEKYAGIVYVRTYGCIKNSTDFFTLCHRLNPKLRIVDDRCLCIPEERPNMFGSDIVLYSTGHCKQIDLGYGGLAYTKENICMPSILPCYNGTDEQAIYKEAYSKGVPMDIIPLGWLNIEMLSDIRSYFYQIELEKLDREKQRERLNKLYNDYLPADIQLDIEYQNWRFNIKVPTSLRQNILDVLFANKLFASNHYFSANRLFDYKIYKYSDELSRSIINLFNDKYYTEDKAVKTIEIINRFISI